MEIVLYEPEIPPNTGNVARLCAATGVALNLVEPLGFSLEDKYLKRAGLDYWPHIAVKVYPHWEALLGYAGSRRLVLSSARHGVRYDRFSYKKNDILVLGPETRGLPQHIQKVHPVVCIPIRDKVRSLNLSTAAGILLFEAMRQTGAGIFQDKG